MIVRAYGDFHVSREELGSTEYGAHLAHWGFSLDEAWNIASLTKESFKHREIKAG